MNTVGMSTYNEHGKPRRDVVHGALQKARTTHGEGGANGWQQAWDMQQALTVQI
jgi:hypothetical protein